MSEGGLAVAAAEMCIGGRLGLELLGTLSPETCFAETNSCLLAEIDPAAEADFRILFAGLPHEKVGTVTAQPVLKIAGEFIAVDALVKAFIPAQ
ncbi:MAG: hypothetical protein L6461_23255 [Anaerolineae bacterium]|nr:hypothetical protein [Anaerolineae bacterium]